MPITEALKKLIKTITGKNAVGETIEELVQNLNDNYPEGSGGGDEYETVAEIAVGTMGESPIFEGYYVPVSLPSVDVAPTISESNTYYFNDTSNACEQIVVNDEMLLIAWGGHVDLETGTITRESSAKPFYAVIWSEDGTSYAINVISSTNAIENTTVRILKKISGGSITVDSALDADSENPVQNKVITAALNERPVDFIITADLDPETEEITNASASLADVLAVAGAVRNIVFILHAAAESGGTTVDVYDRFSNSNIENYGGGNGVAVFFAVENDNGTPLLCRIVAVSGDHDGKWVYDEVALATATP